MPRDRDALRAKLEELRDALRRDQEMSESERSPVELDQTSVGRLSRLDAMQMQEMALANQRRRQTELERVLAALRRIDSEDFGFCDICGEEIPEPRLMHNPAVTTCVGCAR